MVGTVEGMGRRKGRFIFVPRRHDLAQDGEVVLDVRLLESSSKQLYAFKEDHLQGLQDAPNKKRQSFANSPTGHPIYIPTRSHLTTGNQLYKPSICSRFMHVQHSRTRYRETAMALGLRAWVNASCALRLLGDLKVVALYALTSM